MKIEGKKNITLSFVVVTICFALWGFANDMTKPMVDTFQKIFGLSVTDGTMILVAFYGGYFVFALPAALFIRKYSYKTGIFCGLLLFAVGALGFMPAAMIGEFNVFLASYFVLTCGLSMLETSANPYILTMGNSDEGAYRLNLAQAFNPIGSLMGMFAAMYFIQAQISPLSSAERMQLSASELGLVQNSDLLVLAKPYIFIALVAIIQAVVIWILPLHSGEHQAEEFSLRMLMKSYKRVLLTPGVRSGFVAQFFHVGAQIMCWTFIIHYGKQVFGGFGYSESESAQLAQKFNMVAMFLFCVMRFVCTYLIKNISPGALLGVFAAGAITLLGVTIFVGGMLGLYALVGVSACMSLMYPTIYSLALGRLDAQEAKLGGSTQILAILGGCLLPMVQASIIDSEVCLDWCSAVELSFIVPCFCFIVVLYFAFRQVYGE